MESITIDGKKNDFLAKEEKIFIKIFNKTSIYIRVFC